MIWVNPTTASFSSVDDPDAVPLFVGMDRGSLWAMLRAENRETFLAAALSVGLVRNDEFGIRPVSGVTISEIGHLTLERDENGSPARIDHRWHVNFWLSSEIVARMEWIGWALAWTFGGEDITQRNAEEDGAKYLGIELIDPETVRSPVNVLL